MLCSYEEGFGSAHGHRPGPEPGLGPVPGLQIPLSLLLRTPEPAGSSPQDAHPQSHSQTDSRDEEGDEDEEDAEPTFSTPKERECWELFKKMSEKGVSVSYDTVLR